VKANEWIHPFHNVEKVEEYLQTENYIADRSLCLTSKLMFDLEKPMLLEGEAGVGKTELAKVISKTLNTPLIRLQCYEGLDSASALYEWNFARQMLEIRLSENQSANKEAVEKSVFSEKFLLDRPLLQALRHKGEKPAVLLIDEIDRADEEFEAFLLEILSDFQITIPELGTIEAEKRPIVILTSNRSRELNDALKRRCLYLWIDYPSRDKELEIIRRKVPQLNKKLAEKIAESMAKLRTLDLQKNPGIAETIDWSMALLHLDITELSRENILATAGTFLKHRDDINLVEQIDLKEKLDL
tara:strand:- start:2656 stop:3555 length:900 start_codon:yes stop_codon:yes gene_type:complete